MPLKVAAVSGRGSASCFCLPTGGRPISVGAGRSTFFGGFTAGGAGSYANTEIWKVSDDLGNGGRVPSTLFQPAK